MNVSHNAKLAPIGPFRRLMSGLYDWLLVLALAMVGSIPVVMYYGEPVPTGNIAYQLALLGISISYFVYCWTHSGQTPGMKTWYIKLESVDGVAPTPRQCLIRFFGGLISFAALGLGFWWAWGNTERLTWHDNWSDTRLKRMPKRVRKKT